MTDNAMTEKVRVILKDYAASHPEITAQALRAYWLEFEPNQTTALIKVEQREQFEVVGIPAPVLKAIGAEIAKTAKKDVGGFLPLAQLLWGEYGREGRVVALIIFGAMELVEPKRIVPLLKVLCRGCITWEDADRLAMDALEPIVRKDPEVWLGEIASWLDDPNKWVRRVVITIIARLPMKYPALTGQCLEYAAQLLLDTELDVKRAVSFAIRICAKTDHDLARAFLEKHVPAADPAAVWVLCDVIRSMANKHIAAFSSLLPRYQKWAEAPEISGQDRRSLESAIKVLQSV